MYAITLIQQITDCEGIAADTIYTDEYFMEGGRCILGKDMMGGIIPDSNILGIIKLNADAAKEIG